MHGNEYRGWNLLRQEGRKILAGSRQEVMRLIDQKPVRPARAGSPASDLRQQLGEEERPLVDLERLSVDDDIDSLEKQLLGFAQLGRRRGIADRNRIFELIVIALGVEDAELEFLLCHALRQCRRQGRLPDTRAAGDQHAAAIRLYINFRSLAVSADQNAVSSGWNNARILARDHIHYFDEHR